MKILVADDDSICRAMLAIPLKTMAGLDVTEACDGDKAWALLQRNHYDVVILDWQMPGKSGPEITRSLRDTGSQVPVLMVSAEAEKDRVIKAIRAGISDYLIKPFDSTVLLQKLDRLVRRSETRNPRAKACC